MAEVIKSINQNTNGESILVTDVGQHHMVACRYTKFNNSNSNLTSGGLGTMGLHFQQLSELKSETKKESYCCIGDGDFK